MFDLAVRNVRLVGAEGLWNIGISGGLIVAVISAETAIDAKKVLNAEGRLAMPGLIDSHVHTRDPGYTHKEDFRSATMAAANGGITTIMAMPNVNPPMTTPSAVYCAAQAAERSVINIHLVGGLCAGFPRWSEDMARAGAIALDVYDDLFAYGTRTWIQVFKMAKKGNLPLCFYLMDLGLEQDRKKEMTKRGCSELELFSNATNGHTEAISIARIFPLAAYFGIPVVLRMVSTSDGIDMIRTMRRLYPEAQVYVEVCVHYLFLTQEALEQQGSTAHIHPPLRTQRDVEGLWSGIADGTVDYIASDHAPHAPGEKTAFLSTSASGMVGLETMLPLLLDASKKGKLSLQDIQRLCCWRPAEIYGLSKHKGRIAEGMDADLTLVDPDEHWIVDYGKFYTRGAPGPFASWRLTGKPYATICSGAIIMKQGSLFLDGEE